MENKLLFTDKYIEIQCERGDAETQALAASLYPIHKNRTNTRYWSSIHNIDKVLKLFRGIDNNSVDKVPSAIRKLYDKEMRARAGISHTVLDPHISDSLTLMPHQEYGRELALLHDRFCFFYDTRTGKTPLSLSIIYDDLREYPEHKWLVICPLILIDNAWLEDANKFLPNIKTISLHAATPQQRLKKMDEEASIYITNVESFAKYRQQLESKIKFNGCIVDESSTMKSHKSKVSKEIVDFAQSMNRFYLLSGSPAPNGEWEYYMQLKAIDFYGVHQSYTQFKEHFFVNVSYNPQYEKLVVRPDRKDELLEFIGRYSLYVDKEDVLDTPGRTFHEIEIDMPDNLKAAYKEMKNNLALELDDTDIIVNSTAAKLNKLNQITSGFIMDTQAIKENAFYEDSNKEEWYLLDDYRFKKLNELLNNECAGEQVLIWANYRKEFELIKAMLGEKCKCVYGAVSIADKNEAIKDFKQGTIQYLVANPASADKGLTLTNAHICVYFSLNWSYELYKQSMERIYGAKSSQPKHCHYYIMIATGTIDRVLYSDVLQGKSDASYAILNHLKG